MAESGALTVRQLWATTSSDLGDRVIARWLCETAVGLDGDDFAGGLDEAVSQRTVAHLDAMLARYRAGEPLQYVLGRWAFRRLDLAVDRRVLIPRPETEEVAGAALALALAAHRARGAVAVADLGTGSGAIGLSLASELPLSATSVLLTDRSADALDVARANLAGIGRAAVNVRLALGEWFSAVPDGARFDVIVSNPPYVASGSVELEATVREWEPLDALLSGADGLDDLRVIVAGAPQHLRTDGWLVVEHGADQAGPVQAMFGAAGFVDVECRHDAAGRPRMVLGRVTSGRPTPRAAT